MHAVPHEELCMSVHVIPLNNKRKALISIFIIYDVFRNSPFFPGHQQVGGGFISVRLLLAFLLAATAS
jgi:hypothetical protein